MMDVAGLSCCPSNPSNVVHRRCIDSHSCSKCDAVSPSAYFPAEIDREEKFTGLNGNASFGHPGDVLFSHGNASIRCHDVKGGKTFGLFSRSNDFLSNEDPLSWKSIPRSRAEEDATIVKRQKTSKAFLRPSSEIQPEKRRRGKCRERRVTREETRDRHHGLRATHCGLEQTRIEM